MSQVLGGRVSDTKTETAFVLPAEEVSGSSEPVHFGGFPGVWYPGQPIAVSALGFASVKEARAARDELAPNLAEKSVKTGSAAMPVPDNHIPGDSPAIVAAESDPEAATEAVVAAAEGAEQ